MTRTGDPYQRRDDHGGSTKTAGRAWVLHPFLRTRRGSSPASAARSVDAQLDEAVGLAAAIDLEIAGAEIVQIRQARPATLFGPGQVADWRDIIADDRPDLIIIDASLTPVQHRNLEKAWATKVLDRTGLILEIFGARAQTREGTLQVELAALTYQRSRLVRSWTHLERQRGGLGFVGGPGESQLEADRRMIDARIGRLRRALVEVVRTRTLHRAARKRVPYPIVALVGYTNAGKSTLFNRLTGASVSAQDQLFATLDPTMRAITLPSGRKVILSDTVGFISELPTDLVAAFRATLEEVVEADLILHVRDMSHPDASAQAEDVARILNDLAIESDDQERVIEVHNKIDRLDLEQRDIVMRKAEKGAASVAISALDGAGVDILRSLVDKKLGEAREILAIDVAHADGAALAWLHEHGEVIERREGERVAHLRVALDPADAHRYSRRFGRTAAE